MARKNCLCACLPISIHPEQQTHPPQIRLCRLAALQSVHTKFTFTLPVAGLAVDELSLGMRKLIYTLGLILAVNLLGAQTFTSNLNDTIPDNNTVVAFDIQVSGLPAVIDTNFGLETACLNMYHTYCSDMEVRLKAPDGTTVTLFSGVGGGDDNFFNTCLEGSGTPIGQGSAPFTGTFKAQGSLGSINNGQNPNGTWQLLCRDMAGADIGILTMWSVTFGNNPAAPYVFSSSNLPIIKLTTQGQAIPNDPKVPVYMQIIDNGPGVRNYLSQTTYAYEGMIMAELQGFTGPFYPKVNYQFETVDAQLVEMDTTILGMPREQDWILKAEYLDHSLIKNTVTYEMARRMGQYAPRTRACEVFLDGQYQGYYTLTEKIKRDGNRVDIAKLTANDVSGQALTGGYMIEMNINGAPGAWNSVYPPINNATCNLPVEFKHVYPKAAEILPVQANYIRAYVDSFENVLNGPNFADPVTGYRKFVDVRTFIDFAIVNEYSVNYDSYGRSTFMYKEKVTDGGKLKIGPPWDYDRAMDYTVPELTRGWVWQITHPYWPFPFWWSKFWSEQDYRKQFACRWTMLRQDVLHTDSFMVVIDSLHALIDEAAQRNFDLWPDLGNETYQDQIDSLKSYMTRRLTWIDDTLSLEGVAPPAFNIPTDTTVCMGAVYDASFNGPQFSYNWQPGPDTSVITLNQSGLHTLEVTDQWGCYAHKQMNVTISQPDAAFTGQQVGTSLDWTFTPADLTGTSYLWDFGDGGSSTQVSPQHSYATDGSYLVSLSLLDSIGCPAADSAGIAFVYVGRPEANAASPAGAYPNPFRDWVVVDLGPAAKSGASIFLVNELGQRVLEQQIPAGHARISLDTHHLPMGAYRLEIRYPKGSESILLVRQ